MSEIRELADIIYRVNNPKYGDYSSHEETAQAIHDAGWRKGDIDPRLWATGDRDPIVKAVLTSIRLRNVSYDEGMVRMIMALSDYGHRMEDQLRKALDNRTSHTIYVDTTGEDKP